ncbi:fungal-specific transcription factor domain-containing protein [Macrophomina phaseolina]|uniref:Fungal-specific transcription factor domain-containing protein n=1 Tax=Macrophomina phaseolina TaxID=35725 RepID=A0ABQ8FPK9_9PEZI|nr:fungal-specific transcription factor domain-containing protein [Macrophomina phaseolina]
MADIPTPYPRACHECNRKKTKCDMRRPACGLCIRTGASCSYPSKRKSPSSHTPRLTSKSQLASQDLYPLLRLLQAESSRKTRKQSRNASEEPSAPVSTGVSQLLRPMNVPAPSVIQSSPPNHLARVPTSARICPPIGITYHLALHLIDLFFEHIQPWLPLLHEPRFRKYYSERLRVDKSPLQHLPDSEAFLLCSVFALSARFSTMDELMGLAPSQAGVAFFDASRRLQGNCRDRDLQAFTHLQGCILQAFYLYTAGISLQGWIQVGVCARIAYELGLDSIDDDDSAHASELCWVRKEELRRAWWLVWELDTFGSSVSAKPYAIDRRRMTVHLPIPDDAWFAEEMVPSSKLKTGLGQAWTSLLDCKNQSERAWFLVANHLMALTLDAILQKDGLSPEDKIALENDVTCLQLSLPPVFDLETQPFALDSSGYTNANWVVGTRVMLTATLYLLRSRPIGAHLGDELPSAESSSDAALQFRLIELSRILNCWMPSAIQSAHPFYMYALFPVCPLKHPDFSRQSFPIANSVKLILGRFAKKWSLGGEALRVLDLCESFGRSPSADVDLAKRYAVFFPKTSRNGPNRSPSTPSLSATVSPETEGSKEDSNSCALSMEPRDEIKIGFDRYEFQPDDVLDFDSVVNQFAF